MDAGGGRGRGRPVPGRWGLRRGGGPCVQPDPVWAEGRGGPAASLTRDLHGSTSLLCKVELCLLPCLSVTRSAPQSLEVRGAKAREAEGLVEPVGSGLTLSRHPGHVRTGHGPRPLGKWPGRDSQGVWGTLPHRRLHACWGCPGRGSGDPAGRESGPLGLLSPAKHRSCAEVTPGTSSSRPGSH